MVFHGHEGYGGEAVNELAGERDEEGEITVGGLRFRSLEDDGSEGTGMPESKSARSLLG